MADTRPVSRATQMFETNQTVWPLNQPIQKVEAVVRITLLIGQKKMTLHIILVYFRMGKILTD